MHAGTILYRPLKQGIVGVLGMFLSFFGLAEVARILKKICFWIFEVEPVKSLEGLRHATAMPPSNAGVFKVAVRSIPSGPAAADGDCHSSPLASDDPKWN